jgi:hypothetical protein
MRAVGIPFDPLAMQQLSPMSVQQVTLQRHLSRIALECADHTRLRHYFWDVQPECLSAASYGLPGYIKEVRERHRRRPDRAARWHALGS